MLGLERLGRLFGRKEKVVSAASAVADGAASIVNLQLLLSSVSEDPSTWTLRERRIVIGYTDGWCSRLVQQSATPLDASVATIMALRVIFKSAVPTKDLGNDLWTLQQEQEPLFDRARRHGWSDVEEFFGASRGNPIALAGMLLGKINV